MSLEGVSKEVIESTNLFIDRLSEGFYEDQLNQMFSDGPSPYNPCIVEIPDDVYEKVETDSDVFPATRYLLNSIGKTKGI